MQTVITINAVIMALFFVCYSYQFFYVAVALLKRKKFTCRNENHRIAVLIAAPMLFASVTPLSTIFPVVTCVI